jgi:hypothetical protein
MNKLDPPANTEIQSTETAGLPKLALPALRQLVLLNAFVANLEAEGVNHKAEAEFAKACPSLLRV